MDTETFVERTLTAMQPFDRYEVLVLDGEGTVGCLVLVLDDDDPHVGPCASVFTAWVDPALRGGAVGRSMYRIARHLAKDNGHSILAYSHRVKDWQYLTSYWRI